MQRLGFGLIIVMLMSLPYVVVSLGYKTLAIDLAKEGKQQEAHEWFQRHTQEYPGDALGWNNLGVSSMRAGMDAENPTVARDLLLKAKDAYRRSLALRYADSTAENYEYVRTKLAQHFDHFIPKLADDELAQKYSSSFCDPLSAKASSSPCGWDPMNLSTEQVTQAIDRLCRSPKIKISKSERKSGLLDLNKLLSAREKLKVCGVVTFERLFTKVSSHEMRCNRR